MNKRLLLCIGSFFTWAIGWSQPGYTRFATDYTPMESMGIIPQEFITPIKNRVQEATQTIDDDKSDKRITRRDKKDFLLESNNEVDLYLKSGHVVFNTEVNEYINRIAKRILPGDGSANHIRFYLIKYDYSNAFTFNEGVIFVNVGLIARCNNEAEIAFVLGHEYAHYVKKHSINYNTEVKKAQRGEGSYRKKTLDDKKSLMSRYSKASETEADLYGYDLLRKTKYNHYATITSLRSLKFANAIPVLCGFDKTVIEKGTVRIPKTYLYENRKDLSAIKLKMADDDEEEEDENSTHPSVEERIKAVLNEFNSNDTAGKVEYLESTETFETARTICRFEVCRIYLQHNNLDNAFCLTSCLLETYPDNAYLNRVMTTVLYRFAKYANDKKLKDYVARVEKVSGEMKPGNYMLRKLEPEELNLIALRYAWYTHKRFPGSPDISEITNQMFKMYTENYRYTLNMFADASKFNDTIVDHLYELKDQPEPEQLSKTGKNKKIIRRKNTYRFEESLSLYALADLKSDPEFVATFEAAGKKVKELNMNLLEEADTDNEEDESTGKDDDSKQSITKSSEKKNSDAEGDDDRLSIDKLILIEPEFELSDQRKRIAKNYIVNEEEESRIRNAIVQCADKAGFGMNLLNANGIKPGEVQKFNDYCCLKEFVLECFDQGADPNIPTDYNRLKEIAKRYDTRYAAVLINRSVIYRRAWYEFIAPIYIVGFNPILITPWLGTKFFPHKEFIYIIGVLDLEENRLVYGNVLSFNRKESADLFKSQFYATLVTLKGKKR
jgi:hypothetical protein